MITLLSRIRTLFSRKTLIPALNGDGIISRLPIIYCKELVVTPLVIRVDGQMMGYITAYAQVDAHTYKVVRQLPEPDGSFKEITQLVTTADKILATNGC